MMKRLLGIDFGKKRVGIANTDLLQITAKPLRTLENNNNLISVIHKLIKDDTYEKVILGLPPKSHNNEDLIDLINKFKQELEEKSGLSVEYWDESFSSSNAFKKILESRKSKKFRRNKENIDSFAAAEILTDYLENK